MGEKRIRMNRNEHVTRFRGSSIRTLFVTMFLAVTAINISNAQRFSNGRNMGNLGQNRRSSYPRASQGGRLPSSTYEQQRMLQDLERKIQEQRRLANEIARRQAELLRLQNLNRNFPSQNVNNFPNTISTGTRQTFASQSRNTRNNAANGRQRSKFTNRNQQNGGNTNTRRSNSRKDHQFRIQWENRFNNRNRHHSRDSNNGRGTSNYNVRNQQNAQVSGFNREIMNSPEIRNTQNINSMNGRMNGNRNVRYPISVIPSSSDGNIPRNRTAPIKSYSQTQDLNTHTLNSNVDNFQNKIISNKTNNSQGIYNSKEDYNNVNASRQSRKESNKIRNKALINEEISVLLPPKPPVQIHGLASTNVKTLLSPANTAARNSIRSQISSNGIKSNQSDAHVKFEEMHTSSKPDTAIVLRYKNGQVHIGQNYVKLEEKEQNRQREAYYNREKDGIPKVLNDANQIPIPNHVSSYRSDVQTQVSGTNYTNIEQIPNTTAFENERILQSIPGLSPSFNTHMERIQTSEAGPLVLPREKLISADSNQLPAPLDMMQQNIAPSAVSSQSANTGSRISEPEATKEHGLYQDNPPAYLPISETWSNLPQSANQYIMPDKNIAHSNENVSIPEAQHSNQAPSHHVALKQTNVKQSMFQVLSSLPNQNNRQQSLAQQAFHLPKGHRRFASEVVQIPRYSTNHQSQQLRAHGRRVAPQSAHVPAYSANQRFQQPMANVNLITQSVPIPTNRHLQGATQRRGMASQALQVPISLHNTRRPQSIVHDNMAVHAVEFPLYSNQNTKQVSAQQSVAHGVDHLRHQVQHLNVNQPVVHVRTNPYNQQGTTKQHVSQGNDNVGTDSYKQQVQQGSIEQMSPPRVLHVKTDPQYQQVQKGTPEQQVVPRVHYVRTDPQNQLVQQGTVEQHRFVHVRKDSEKHLPHQRTEEQHVVPRVVHVRNKPHNQLAQQDTVGHVAPNVVHVKSVPHSQLAQQGASEQNVAPRVVHVKSVPYNQQTAIEQPVAPRVVHVPLSSNNHLVHQATAQNSISPRVVHVETASNNQQVQQATSLESPVPQVMHIGSNINQVQNAHNLVPEPRHQIQQAPQPDSRAGKKQMFVQIPLKPNYQKDTLQAVAHKTDVRLQTKQNNDHNLKAKEGSQNNNFQTSDGNPISLNTKQMIKALDAILHGTDTKAPALENHHQQHQNSLQSNYTKTHTTGIQVQDITGLNNRQVLQALQDALSGTDPQNNVGAPNIVQQASQLSRESSVMAAKTQPQAITQAPNIYNSAPAMLGIPPAYGFPAATVGNFHMGNMWNMNPFHPGSGTSAQTSFWQQMMFGDSIDPPDPPDPTPSAVASTAAGIPKLEVEIEGPPPTTTSTTTTVATTTVTTTTIKPKPTKAEPVIKVSTPKRSSPNIINSIALKIAKLLGTSSGIPDSPKHDIQAKSKATKKVVNKVPLKSAKPKSKTESVKPVNKSPSNATRLPKTVANAQYAKPTETKPDKALNIELPVTFLSGKMPAQRKPIQPLINAADINVLKANVDPVLAGVNVKKVKAQQISKGGSPALNTEYVNILENFKSVQKTQTVQPIVNVKLDKLNDIGSILTGAAFLEPPSDTAKLLPANVDKLQSNKKPLDLSQNNQKLQGPHETTTAAALVIADQSVAPEAVLITTPLPDKTSIIKSAVVDLLSQIKQLWTGSELSSATTTPVPCTPDSPDYSCIGIGMFSEVSTIGNWCLEKCRTTGCVESVCKCTCPRPTIPKLGVAGWKETTTESALGGLDRANTTDVPEEIEPTVRPPSPAERRTRRRYAHLCHPLAQMLNKACGEGPNSQKCPVGSKCVIARDGFNFCCWTDRELPGPQKKPNRKRPGLRKGWRRRRPGRNRKRRLRFRRMTTPFMSTLEPPEDEEIEQEDAVTTTPMPTTTLEMTTEPLFYDAAPTTTISPSFHDITLSAYEVTKSKDFIYDPSADYVLTTPGYVGDSQKYKDEFSSKEVRWGSDVQQRVKDKRGSGSVGPTSGYDILGVNPDTLGFIPDIQRSSWGRREPGRSAKKSFSWNEPGWNRRDSGHANDRRWGSGRDPDPRGKWPERHTSWDRPRGRSDRWHDPPPLREHGPPNSWDPRDQWKPRDGRGRRGFGLRNRWRETTTKANEEEAEGPEANDK